MLDRREPEGFRRFFVQGQNGLTDGSWKCAVSMVSEPGAF